MKKFAFTLAEVLITLGIIGVVAALTIPTLIQNQQKTQYAIALTKTVSVLNQAFFKYAADNGCPGDIGCSGLFSDTVSNNSAKWDDFVNNYLKVAKTCAYMTTPDCFASHYKYLDNSATISVEWGITSSRYSIMLNDGASIIFRSGANDCTSWGTAFGGGLCTQLPYIDVNGPKGPNILGRDLFVFAITRNKGIIGGYGSNLFSNTQCGGSANCLWSTGTQQYRCSATSSSTGDGCLARIMDEGWQMNY